MIIFIILFFLCFSSELHAAPDGYRLEWEESFSGEILDPVVWRLEEYVRDDAQLTKNSVSLRDGTLRISTYSKNGVVYTGFVTSKGRNFLYGYFEARIRFIGAPGQHCAFWLQSSKYSLGDSDPALFGVEVDIVEHSLFNRILVDVGNRALFNIHWNGYGRKHKTEGGQWLSPTTLNEKWHVYAVLWSQEGYFFYVDGIERWRTDRAVSAVPQEIRLTCEVKSGTWKGDVPREGFGPPSPISPGMEVDWVKVWSR